MIFREPTAAEIRLGWEPDVGDPVRVEVSPGTWLPAVVGGVGSQRDAICVAVYSAPKAGRRWWLIRIWPDCSFPPYVWEIDDSGNPIAGSVPWKPPEPAYSMAQFRMPA